MSDPDDREPTPPPQWGAAAGNAVDTGVRRARATATALHQSEAWRWARRYLPVYRWATDLQDKTIAGLVAGGWG
ncbi:MAG: hypothetical protein IE923_18890, partial [Micrococcales bacterium]|nr:hypothetical protein [Micrococcales bacterium]